MSTPLCVSFSILYLPAIRSMPSTGFHSIHRSTTVEASMRLSVSSPSITDEYPAGRVTTASKTVKSLFWGYQKEEEGRNTPSSPIMPSSMYATPLLIWLSASFGDWNVPRK